MSRLVALAGDVIALDGKKGREMRGSSNDSLGYPTRFTKFTSLCRPESRVTTFLLDVHVGHKGSMMRGDDVVP